MSSKMNQARTIFTPAGAGRPSAHAHPLIRQTAVEMAQALYETMMTDNRWYDYWKRLNPGLTLQQLERRFVRKNLASLLPQARATLAGMLPLTTDPKLAESIYEALCLDATLLRGRQAKPAKSILLH